MTSANALLVSGLTLYYCTCIYIVLLSGPQGQARAFSGKLGLGKQCHCACKHQKITGRIISWSGISCRRHQRSGERIVSARGAWHVFIRGRRLSINYTGTCSSIISWSAVVLCSRLCYAALQDHGTSYRLPCGSGIPSLLGEFVRTPSLAHSSMWYAAA